MAIFAIDDPKQTMAAIGVEWSPGFFNPQWYGNNGQLISNNLAKYDWRTKSRPVILCA